MLLKLTEIDLYENRSFTTYVNPKYIVSIGEYTWESDPLIEGRLVTSIRLTSGQYMSVEESVDNVLMALASPEGDLLIVDVKKEFDYE